MNVPGFAAEATLYISLTSYGSDPSTQIGMGLNVMPQLSLNWPEVRCRVNCLNLFRATPHLFMACLAAC
jgi:hypothetical protein